MSKEKPTLGTGLIHRDKGDVQKPIDMSAPVVGPAPKPTPPSDEPKTKSLTLRLSESQYARLRRFAFDRDRSHQAVIEAALLRYLESEEG